MPAKAFILELASCVVFLHLGFSAVSFLDYQQALLQARARGNSHGGKREPTLTEANTSPPPSRFAVLISILPFHGVQASKVSSNK